MTSDELLQNLSRLNVSYELHTHPALLTCEDARQHLGNANGHGTKNLFLRNEKKDRYYIVSVSENKKVDLKELRKVLHESKLSFGSPEDLHRCLGLAPGSVTLLGVVNDVAGNVHVCVDRVLWNEERLQCHPLVNTQTVTLARADLERVLSEYKHSPKVIDVPGTTETA